MTDFERKMPIFNFWTQTGSQKVGGSNPPSSTKYIMNPTLITGTVIVTFALISYSIAVITEQRKHSISKFILTFLTIGITLDITATIVMIIGSSNIPLTFHGILGYSALIVMLADTICIWRLKLNHVALVPRKLHLYTRVAYSWWVIAYFAGSFIAMFDLY
jgi:hypothetical protein